MKWLWVSSGLVAGVCAVGWGCSEVTGNFVVENQSSRDIVIKFPHDGPFSEAVPAHSTASVMTNIQISGRTLYADVFDAKTKQLLLTGPGAGETTFAEKGQVRIVYEPAGDSKRPPTGKSPPH